MTLASFRSSAPSGIDFSGVGGLARDILWLAGAFLLPLCLILAPAGAQGREKGWVPLKGNDASSIQAPRSSLAKQYSKKSGKAAAKPAGQKDLTVYANQPPVTEKEVSSFIEALPRFRVWASKNGEEARPVVSSSGQPDFLYSDNAARWVSSNNFDPPRFFCIMGRLAAGLVIVTEGNDFKGTRPPDMPSVDPQEIMLVRKHMSQLLSVGGRPGPIRQR